MPVHTFANGRIEPPFPRREDFYSQIDDWVEVDGERHLLFYPVDAFEISKPYALLMMGTLPSGRRATVKINGIYPSIYVEVDRKSESMREAFEALRERMAPSPLYAELPAFDDLETRTVKNGKGYRSSSIQVAELFFPSTNARKEAILSAKALGLQTFSDGSPYSFLDIFLTRNFLSIAEWWAVRQPAEEGPLRDRDVLCFSAMPDDITLRTVPLAGDAPRFSFTSSLPSAPPLIALSWDIENFSRTGEIKDPKLLGGGKEDEIFMIGGGIGFISEPEPFLEFCVSSCSYARDHSLGLSSNERTHLVFCESEKDILLAYAAIAKAFLPEYRLAFNNYGYDDPYVYNRASKHYHIFEQMVIDMAPCNVLGLIKRNFLSTCCYKDIKLKQEAGIQTDRTYLLIPGSVNIDMMFSLQKLNTKKEEVLESQALATYLESMGLQPKLDVSHIQMWDYYERRDGEGMAKVIEYCIVDAVSCHRLQHKKGVIMQFVSLSHSSFCSVRDSIMKANSGKVKNNIHAVGNRLGLVYTDTDDKVEGRFPGAYVIDPVGGIHKDVPTFCLDFASLYPSIIRALNMSSETYIKDANEVADLRSKGYDIFTYEWRDANGLPHGASFIRAHPDGSAYECVYAKCLAIYADLRKECKREMALAEKRGLPMEVAEWDNKQKAVKILMNTFYGVLGSSTFSLCEKVISSCICMFGRFCLNTARETAEERGHRVIYGDTDSIFVSPSIAHSEIITEMLAQTNEIASSLLIAINERISSISRSHFIKMEYDKLLYPLVLLGKKQYYGYAWCNETLTKKKGKEEKYVSGLPYKKRGKTNALKDAAQRVVDYSLDISTTETMMDIVHRVLTDAVASQADHPMEYYARMARYNVGKDSVATKFIARMQREHDEAARRHDIEKLQLYTVPKAGELFQYVVRKPLSIYNTSGCKRKMEGTKTYLTVGSKWEFLHVAKHYGYEIDYSYYMSDIIKALARFINYDMVVEVKEGAEKKADEERKKKAEAHLEDFIRGERGVNRNWTARRKAASQAIAAYAERSPFLSRAFQHMYDEDAGIQASQCNQRYLMMRLISDSGPNDMKIKAEEAVEEVERCLSRLEGFYPIMHALYDAFIKDMRKTTDTAAVSIENIGSLHLPPDVEDLLRRAAMFQSVVKHRHDTGAPTPSMSAGSYVKIWLKGDRHKHIIAAPQ